MKRGHADENVPAEEDWGKRFRPVATDAPLVNLGKRRNRSRSPGRDVKRISPNTRQIIMDRGRQVFSGWSQSPSGGNIDCDKYTGTHQNSTAASTTPPNLFQALGNLGKASKTFSSPEMPGDLSETEGADVTTDPAVSAYPTTTVRRRPKTQNGRCRSPERFKCNGNLPPIGSCAPADLSWSNQVCWTVFDWASRYTPLCLAPRLGMVLIEYCISWGCAAGG
jgi:hypothetical protein